MKQSIQLRFGQHLVMTPQLRQAIKLLQLSTLDLQTAIQEQLDSNPMLEVDEDPRQTADADEAPGNEPASEANHGTETIHADPTDTAAENRPETTGPATESNVSDRVDHDSGESLASGQQEHIPDDLPVDVDWGALYDGNTSYSQPAGGEHDADYYEIAGAQKGEGLQPHLRRQLEMIPMEEQDRLIAEVILDALEPNGYLLTPMADLLAALPETMEADAEEVEAVLHRIQRLDPIGIAARNPAECLALQLETLPADTPHLESARLIVTDHLEPLANQDLQAIQRRLRINQDELQGAITIIRSLTPHPGDLANNEEPEYIVPDILVRREKDRWQVELNPETAPKLRINRRYADLIQHGDHGGDNAYLRNHLQEARWFIKNLHGRNETLLKVATAIVERQQAFLDRGDEAMVPLVLRDVATAVDMHESTISRVTSQKYMHTPRGIYEFKHFFSSHVGTADGGECSATAIRAMIRTLCSEEPPGKPLSDNKIARILGERGINVARRTVAKYRESMRIPPSNERKRLV